MAAAPTKRNPLSHPKQPVGTPYVPCIGFECASQRCQPETLLEQLTLQHLQRLGDCLEYRLADDQRMPFRYLWTTPAGFNWS